MSLQVGFESVAGEKGSRWTLFVLKFHLMFTLFSVVTTNSWPPWWHHPFVTLLNIRLQFRSNTRSEGQVLDHERIIIINHLG